MIEIFLAVSFLKKISYMRVILLCICRIIVKESSFRYQTDVYTTGVTMLNGTCAKLSNMREQLRENMDWEIFFEKYTLSEETVTKLESIKKRMQNQIAQANPTWKVIAGEVSSRDC